MDNLNIKIAYFISEVEKNKESMVTNSSYFTDQDKKELENDIKILKRYLFQQTLEYS